MIGRRISPGRFAGLLAGFGLLTLLGCGADEGIPTRYAVSGQVTYNGAAVPKGTISFFPEDPNSKYSATGTIVDGSYRLTTHTDGDGAVPGKYKVVIAAVEVDTSKLRSEVAAKGGRVDGAIPPELAAKAPKKDLIPRKYGSQATSGLEATVEAKPNTIGFTLTD